jgi:hypothetical protein
MLGSGEKLVRWCHLDQTAYIHHRHAIADVPDYAEVVGHKEIGQTSPLASPRTTLEALP